MNSADLTLLAVGDLILDMPQAESYFEKVAPVLRAADLAVGHVEVVFTSRGICSSTDVAAPPCAPENMKALRFAGFDVVTLAGNHIWDSGPAGIEDTLAGLGELGIAATGAGMNLSQACKPALVERSGVRFGFLSYNCVGPRESWATERKPGCAYVQILTHYELDHATPGGPPKIYTFAEPGSLKAMVSDIRELRSGCDVVVVSLHKGIGHVPAKLAAYELEVAHAAVDAGADLVVGHHAHILRGIELYRGKPIFHGLGNFVTVTRALSAGGESLEDWARRRRELFGFEPDTECPWYPFHPESRQTIIAKCVVNEGRILRVSCLPCFIDQLGRPEVLQRQDARAEQVFSYLDRITRQAGLNARYSWDDGEILIRD